MKGKPALISFIAIGITMLIGVSVIIGWIINNEWLLAVIPGFVTMKFNVAVCFVLCAVVLLLRRGHTKATVRYWLSFFIAVVIIITGLLTLTEYIFGINIGIDEFLVKDTLHASGTYYAGRMSPLSAINFVLTGTGLLLLHQPKTAAYHFIYVLGIIFTSLLMLIGFNFINDIPAFIRIAIHTAIGFITLSTAIWFSQPMLRQKLSFERTISLGFTAALILIIVTSVFFSYYNNKRSSTAKLLHHTTNVLSETELVLSLVKDIESGARGYVITGDSAYLNNFLVARHDVYDHINNLEALTQGYAFQQARVDSLRALSDRRIGFSLQCIRLRNEKGLSGASMLMATGEGKFLTDSIRQLITAMRNEENDLLSGRQRENAESISSFNRTFFIFLLSVFALLLVLLLAILNNISIRKKSEQEKKESAEQIQTIFNAAPDAVIVINGEGNIIQWNPKASSLFGWSATEVMNRSLSDVIIPERYRDAHRMGMKRFLATGHGPVLHTTIEIQALNKEHTEFDIALSISPTLVNGSNLFISFIRDITEQKKAIAKIKQDEEIFSNLFYKSPIMKAIVEAPTGRYIEVNDAFASFMQKSKEEILGRTSVEFNMGVPAGDRVQILENIEKYGSVRDVETQISGNGQTRWVSSNIDKITLNGRQCYLSAGIDITARKEAEARIIQMNADLEKRVAEKTREIANSERKFRTLVENSTDIISLLDEKFQPVYRSPSSERITGWSNEEREPIGGTDLIHPDDLSAMQLTLKEMFAYPGKPYPISFRTMHKQGHYLWMEGVITNMLHDDSIGALLANMRDVTQRKEAEEKLIKSEKIYKTIASSIPGSVICLLDTNLKYLLIEGDMVEKLGYSKDKLLGARLEDVLPAENFAHILPLLKKVLSGETVTRETNNSGYDIFTRLIPLKDEHHEVYAVMTVTIDVTDLKKAQQDVAELNRNLEEKIMYRTEQLKKSNDELEAFSYSISHDLRAPLRGIIGFASMLEEDYGNLLDEEGKRITAVIRNNTLKMGNLIDDLLNFSRVGRLDILKTAIDTNKIVEAAKNELNNNNTQGINWQIQSLPHTFGDIPTIRQVWINLMSNAVKYSARVGRPEIIIGSMVYEGATTFFIKDNGIGFDNKYNSKLFKVFQRLHTAEEFEGTGVGLAIVHKIISKHGGKIWAEAEPGKGAAFYFSLPEM